MRTETLHPVTDYIEKAITFITREESFRHLPYFDTATPPRATIGYGFNIEVPDYLLLVLRQMGIINGTMTRTDINAVLSVFTDGINNTPHTGDLVLQTNLNRIARQYYGADGFFINRTQGTNIIREIILGLNDGNIVVQGKEARLDALLRDPITGQSTLAHNSKEYVAVMSLFYNLETLVDSPRRLLANAIISDNRAEAWYEIRYNSNADGQHAARRYTEADLFGLYDAGTLTADEQIAQAKEIMRMFTRYEVENLNLSGKRLSEYEYTYPPPANKDIFNSIKPASDLLVAQFAMGNTIDGFVIVGKGLDSYNYIERGNWSDNNLEGDYYNDLMFGEKGNDKLSGFNGNDVIYGGEGNDILIGGIGNDTLIGGENDDTYIIKYGEGTDTIIDTQGRNKIIHKGLDGKERIIDNFYTSSSGSNITADGKATLTHNSPWQIIFDDGTVIELGEGCTPENFGIDLVDLPDDISTPELDISNTIVGDLKPVDFDPVEEGIQVQYDQWGNVIVDPEQPEPGRNDVLHDTTASDKIEGMAGDDLIYVGKGTEDWAIGGDGNEIASLRPVSCEMRDGAGLRWQ